MIDYNDKMTLDVVLKLKREKLEKIRDSQKKIGKISKDLFSPNQNVNPVESVLKRISMGFDIYDGIKIGLGVVRKIKDRMAKKKS